jgi:hypothetical protein
VIPDLEAAATSAGDEPRVLTAVDSVAVADGGSRGLGPRGRRRAFFAVSAAIVAGVALVLSAPAAESTHEYASGIGVVAGGLALSGACVYQAMRSTVRRRTQAWTLWAAASAVATLGNIVLLAVGTSMGPSAGLSLPDACLLLSLVMCLSALVRFPATPRRPAEVARIVMDGVIVGGSLVFFASVTLFPQIAPDGNLANRAGPLLVPVIDTLIATTALLLYIRRNHNEGAFLGFVSLGFISISVSDFAAAIVTFRPGVGGRLLHHRGGTCRRPGLRRRRRRTPA